MGVNSLKNSPATLIQLPANYIFKKEREMLEALF